MIIGASISKAQVKEHVKAIEAGTKTNSPKPNSEPKRPGFFEIFFASEIEFVTSIIFMPFFPILYETLDLPNSIDDKTPTKVSSINISAGTTDKFKTLNINSFYKYKYLNVKVDFIKFTEGNFISDFSTIGASFTPNWNKVFKTGIGAGIRLINYDDTDSKTTGSISGFVFELPTTLSFNPKVNLYYSPRYVFYERGVTAFEIDGGLQYNINPRWNIKMGVEKRITLSSSKKDFVYSYFGTGFSF